MKPTVLMATTFRWIPTARLAVALADAGCSVESVCPAGHPLFETSAGQKTYPYHALAGVRSFANAIEASNPDLVIPTDDLATQHLLELHRRQQRNRKKGSLVCGLIERSLGAAESFPVFYARTKCLELAREEGIRVPLTEVVASREELTDWLSRTGFPAVLKLDGTTGGEGVKIVRSVKEAERAFRVLHAPPLLARAAKRALLDSDATLVWPSILRHRSPVNAQAFIEGHEATTVVACWNGNVLAVLHFEVLKKRNATGPATVVRLIDHDEMSAASAAMVRRLRLSGLHGFDFMLEANTGNAFLIEMNPRTTQVGHLKLGLGRDLPAALFAVLSDRRVEASPKVTENDTIALFPHEWMRDPASRFLRQAYHDVPWEEPDLVRACVRDCQKQSAAHSQRNWIQDFSAVRATRT